MISATVLDGMPLNGYLLQKQRTITVRIMVVGSGLTGGGLKFVAKDLTAIPDLDDSRASIIKITPGSIVVDATASNDQVLIARMQISPLDTQNLLVDSLYWGIQFQMADGTIPFNELQGTLRIDTDRVKTPI